MTTPGSTSKHLLTVIHSAERTGPPLIALQFLRWLRRHHPEWQTSILALDAGGELEEEFAELGTVVVAGADAPYANGKTLMHRRLISQQHRRLRRRLTELGPLDAVHVHCAGTMRVMPALPNAPVLCHLHELDVGLELHLGPLARDVLCSADRYLAASDGVRSTFLERFPVSPSLVRRQWEFVDAARLPPPSAQRDLTPPGESFVVASSGVRNWRKAPEFFVRVAIESLRLAPWIPWHFLWVGGSDASGLAELVESAGLSDNISFLEHQADPLGTIARADAFFLPAREDAFPLVCVEAAAMGLPIVTFDSGGAAELVRQAGCGSVVRFPDVEGAACALRDIASDAPYRAELSQRAQTFAHQNLLLDQAGPSILRSIDETREAR